MENKYYYTGYIIDTKNDKKVHFNNLSSLDFIKFKYEYHTENNQNLLVFERYDKNNENYYYQSTRKI